MHLSKKYSLGSYLRRCQTKRRESETNAVQTCDLIPTNRQHVHVFSSHREHSVPWLRLLRQLQAPRRGLVYANMAFK